MLIKWIGGIFFLENVQVLKKQATICDFGVTKFENWQLFCTRRKCYETTYFLFFFILFFCIWFWSCRLPKQQLPRCCITSYLMYFLTSYQVYHHTVQNCNILLSSVTCAQCITPHSWHQVHGALSPKSRDRYHVFDNDGYLCKWQSTFRHV